MQINILVQGRDGLFLVNRHDQYISSAMQTYGEFSRLEFDLFQQILRPGDSVIEVGANMGSHTVGLSQHVGPQGFLMAFEPQPPIFQILCANIALNDLLHVECFPFAVGHEPGVIKIPPIDYTKHNSFGSLSMIPASSEGSERDVQQVRLDDMYRRERLNLIKIDVEGMEKDVLQGAQEIISRHRPFLYVENDRVEKSDELIEYIRSLDYRLWWHIPLLFSKTNFRNKAENIYGNICSFNMFCAHRSLQINCDLAEVAADNRHPLQSSNVV